MSYHIDPLQGDIVIDSFQNGIGASPYSGITDMKSVNPVSVPGEASISFSTSSVSAGPQSSTTISATAVGDGFVVLGTGFVNNVLLEIGHAVLIVTSSITGLTVGTIYFIQGGGKQSTVSENLGFSTTPGGGAHAIGTTGTATFTTLQPSVIKYHAKSNAHNFMVDSLGLVWSDTIVTSGATTVPSTGSWTYMGNAGNIGSAADSTANGNGLVVYRTIYNNTGGVGASGNPAAFDEWLFVWRNDQIDYTQLTSNNSSTAISWQYQWNPTAGTVGGSPGYLQTSATNNNPHMAIQTLPNIIVYTDSFFMGVFSQNVPALSSTNYTGFNPKDKTTYYYNNFNILPPNEVAQCITFLNQYVLIGSSSNLIYPWHAEGLALKYNAPAIILPEPNTSAIITAGNNAYVFAGNRGIIYVTNGSQASVFQKIPDHLSGTVEPYFWWGGSFQTPQNAPTGTGMCQKNRLYFGFTATSQSTGNLVSGYGGIWCIDLTTGALWNSNQLSYGTYAGCATDLFVPTQFTNSDKGYGVVAGWWDGNQSTPHYGIDVPTANPYATGCSIITSDLIPTGIFLKPSTPMQFEFKTSVPLNVGESVQILAGYSLADYINGTMTNVGTISGDNTGTVLSGNLPSTVASQQWLIVQAVLTYTSSTPSYNRLFQLRVIGDSLKTQVAGQPYAIR